MTFKSKVPPGVSGAWKVEHCEVSVSDEQWGMLYASLHHTRRYVPVGTYTRLLRNGCVVMSDTPDELADFQPFAFQANGSVLINGLGLGCLVQTLLEKPNITKLTVVEVSEDVIKLVAPHLADGRLTVIQADAYRFVPPKGERFDFVWHDIWDNLCTDNLDDMEKLHRKYARRCSHQASWGKELLQQRRRREQRWGWAGWR